MTADYWVIRDPSFAGSVDVAVDGLPADVDAAVDPPTLSFPAGATGQQVHLGLTTVAGPTVPDTFVNLHLTGPGADVSFPILLHGTCWPSCWPPT